MAYEDSAGLNVHNQYGPRASGGEQGVEKTFGIKNQFVVNLPVVGLYAYKLPIRNNIKVIGVNKNFVTGTVTALTVGGVDITSATEAAPVALSSSNTGVVEQTGGTSGYLVIYYTNVAGDAFDVEGS
jgi:hypothetical protein